MSINAKEKNKRFCISTRFFGFFTQFLLRIADWNWSTKICLIKQIPCNHTFKLHERVKLGGKTSKHNHIDPILLKNYRSRHRSRSHMSLPLEILIPVCKPNSLPFSSENSQAYKFILKLVAKKIELEATKHCPFSCHV